MMELKTVKDFEEAVYRVELNLSAVADDVNEIWDWFESLPELDETGIIEEWREFFQSHPDGPVEELYINNDWAPDWDELMNLLRKYENDINIEGGTNDYQ